MGYKSCDDGQTVVVVVVVAESVCSVKKSRVSVCSRERCS